MLSLSEAVKDSMRRAVQNATVENLQALDAACAEDRLEEIKRGGGDISLREQAYEVIHRIVNSAGVIITPENLFAAAELVKSGLLTCHAGDEGELYLEPVMEEPRTPTSE